MNSVFEEEFTAILAEVENEFPLPTDAPGWGSDLACLDDVGANFEELDGNDPQLIAEAAYRCIITNPGELADDPDWGGGLLSMLSAGYTTQQIREIGETLRGALSVDDRLENVQVLPQYDYATETLIISVSADIVDSDNDFSFVVNCASGAANLVALLVNGEAANGNTAAVA